MSAKKELSKFLTEQITEWLKSGGMVNKVPPGAAKGAKDDIEARPKNLPKTKQGRSIKFNADGDMVAVGNLSTPLKKNFSSEATIKVKLTY